MKIKLTKKRIKEIINEEIDLFHERLILEYNNPTSKLEMEELLRNYFNRYPMPENIYQLSVLFPILEKAGLKDVVDAYKVMKRERSPEQAMMILDDVQEVLMNIKNNPNDVDLDDDGTPDVKGPAKIEDNDGF